MKINTLIKLILLLPLTVSLTTLFIAWYSGVDIFSRGEEQAEALMAGLLAGSFTSGFVLFFIFTENWRSIIKGDDQ